MTKKTVLITGCSEGGIGDALAQEFHRRGLRVFATARDLSKIEHLKTLGLIVLRLDMTDESSIKHAVETVKSATKGSLDFLVNNSGAGTQDVSILPLPSVYVDTYRLCDATLRLRSGSGEEDV